MYGQCHFDLRMKEYTMRLEPVPKPLAFFNLPVLVATFGGVGLIRPAPGTWGSFAAFLLALIVLYITDPVTTETILSLAILVCFSFGIWASRKYEEASGRRDNQSIVIDEVCGMWLTVILIPWPFGLGSFVLALVLFRLFDIFKPWPIRRIETRLSRGWDVMVDDIAAAFYAGIVMLVAYLFLGEGFHAA